MSKPSSITILGAGVTGLWQALTLARTGYSVRLYDNCEIPFANASSLYAGAMLAPFCEEESAEPLIRTLGLQAIDLWRQETPDLIMSKGSLVIAHRRDQNDLLRFARMTTEHNQLDGTQLATLEPELDGRFDRALFFPREAHLDPRKALPALLAKVQNLGVTCHFGPYEPHTLSPADWIIDCTGMGAAQALPNLRGVRGERLILHAPEVTLGHTIRLLHPRFPIYVVPWGNHHYMIGATVIESEDRRGVTLRSALELLGTAYSLHPSFAESEILEMGAGIRPAFPDNIPKIIRRGKTLYVNGLYRHGFLLAPALAEITRTFLMTGQKETEIFIDEQI